MLDENESGTIEGKTVIVLDWLTKVLAIWLWGIVLISNQLTREI